MSLNRINRYLQDHESQAELEMRHASVMASAIAQTCPDVLTVEACPSPETGQVQLCWGIAICFNPIERDDLLASRFIIAKLLRELAPVLADIARCVEGGAAC